MRTTKVAAAVSRLGLLERIRLSPEDYSEGEMRRLTQTLLADGVRVFVFSFHSPSVMPGGTPYVRSEKELERFLGKCRGYFGYFMRELHGVASTPVELRRMLRDRSAGKP
jgi:hypothetical protein